MADNQLVSNSYLSTNPDIRPRAIEKTSGGNACLTQVMAIDIGGSGAESLVTGANPLPISGSISVGTASVTPAAPSAVSVGIASTSVLGSATYKRVELVNTSTATISIGLGAAAVLNSGYTLIGTGSSCTIEGPFTSTVTAIASVAASNLAVQAFT